MASRKEQKEQARQRRMAQAEALTEREQRRRRVQILGGVSAAAIIVVVAMVAIAAGSNPVPVKPHSKAALAAVKHVDALLAGIPESGTTLGNPKAPVTVTEYGDLECSVCDELAAPPSFTNPEGEAGTGFEDDLITQDVRTGKVKLVYRSLETASSEDPNANAFALQQAAANAAGLQDKAWYYIELFYNEQGAEGTGYVTESFLEGIARQIHPLSFVQWMTDRKLASVKNQVTSDNARGIAVGEKLSQGVSTPTVIVRGPKGKPAALQGLTSSTWSDLQAAIGSVS
jgi:protein-disulfide isomerase